jgi:hypothetical protein
MSNQIGTANGVSFEETNWDEVSDKPAPLKPGVYRAQTVSATAEESKKGNMMVVHELELLNRYGDDTHIGYKRKDYIALTEKTKGKIKNVMRGLGCPPPRNSFLDGVEAWAQAIESFGANGFWVLLGEESYEKDGQTFQSTKVKRYVPEAELEEAVARAALAEATSSGASANGTSSASTGRKSRELNA